MKKADIYKELFNKEYLMGPNSVRLLEEMLEKYPLEQGIRVLVLGCGKGLTSLFLAKDQKLCLSGWMVKKVNIICFIAGNGG